MANDPESPAQDAPVAKDAEPSAVVTISKNMKYTGSVNVPFRLVPGEGLTAESYATSSAAVATVDGATGIVEPQKTGSCKITVNLSNGKKLSLSLKVIDPTRVVVTGSRSKYLDASAEATFEITALPTPALDKSAYNVVVGNEFPVQITNIDEIKDALNGEELWLTAWIVDDDGKQYGWGAGDPDTTFGEAFVYPNIAGSANVSVEASMKRVIEDGWNTFGTSIVNVPVTIAEAGAGNPLTVTTDNWDVRVAFGEPATLSLTATSADGAALTYRWYYRTDHDHYRFYEAVLHLCFLPRVCHPLKVFAHLFSPLCPSSTSKAKNHFGNTFVIYLMPC